MWTSQETWQNRLPWSSPFKIYSFTQKGAVFSAFFIETVVLDVFFCQKSIMHA